MGKLRPEVRAEKSNYKVGGKESGKTNKGTFT